MYAFMKAKISAIIALLLPSFIAVRLLNLLGHRIHPTAKIGFSWLQCQTIEMAKNSKVGHLNLIRIISLHMAEDASIRKMNRMKGPFRLKMDKQAAIGNSNSIYRGAYPITLGEAELRMGRLAIITSKHSLDCTRSISIGDYSTISGFGTQFWTHGFYHGNEGAHRIRIDGSIEIGNNVSIGSKCLINPAVKIGNAINVGGNSCVSKSLLEPGMYVSQVLRYIPYDISTIKSKLQQNKNYTVAHVYEKTTA
jgi:acetyltransferase-like isoleucine patch superfamily enzyme